MTTISVGLSDRWLTAQSVKNRSIVPDESLRVRIVDRVGTFKCVSHSCNGRVDIAEHPEHPRHEGQDGHASVLADRAGSYLLGFLTCSEQPGSAFDHLSGINEAPQKEEDHCLHTYRINQCRPITPRVGSAQ